MSARAVHGEIDACVQLLAEARDDLATVIREIRRKHLRATRLQLPAIRQKRERVLALETQLARLIERNRTLFRKPRTQRTHGIRFGLRKAPDKLAGDQEVAIAIIEDEFDEERRYLLVRVAKSLILGAVKELPEEDLKRIGLTVVHGGDAVVLSYGDEIDADLRWIDKSFPEEDA